MTGENTFHQLLDTEYYDNGRHMLPDAEYRAWLAQNMLRGFSRHDASIKGLSMSKMAEYALRHEAGDATYARAVALGIRAVLPEFIAETPQE